MNPIANLHRDIEAAMDEIKIYAGGKKYHLAKKVHTPGTHPIYLTWCGKTGHKSHGDPEAKGLTPCKNCYS